MLLRLNPAFDAMANKLSTGIVAYQIFNRQLSRFYVVPNNPSTVKQGAVRTAFTIATVAFSALTVAEAAAWGAVAALMSPRSDSLGRPYAWTAKSLYQAVNNYRALAGVATTDTPPTNYVALKPAWPAQLTIDGTNMVWTGTSHPDATATNAKWLIVRITLPIGTTAAVARRTDLRFVLTPTDSNFNDIAAGGLLEIDFDIPSVLANLGFTPTIGQRVGVEVTTLTSDYVPANPTFANNVPMLAP